MVEFVPMAVVPRYCSGWVHYLPTEVSVSSVVPWVSFTDEQELWVVKIGFQYSEELIDGEPSPCAPSGAARACCSEIEVESDVMVLLQVGQHSEFKA